ncbi:MAG TPA: MoxR family ATPase [Planctomycetota bacterium]|jgi:MoxR-like ATPase|nr:MoxR family ATPase [Planctomycetota bacterium]
MNEIDDVTAAQQLKAGHDRIRTELGKVIVGQDAVIDQLIVALFARGHCILTGVPGLAKTLLISSLARTLKLEFKRVQFTPDLMPTDITGTEIIQENRTTGQRELVFIEGPVFTNVLLADEINRTPPRTQAALLEAMQDRQVTTGGVRRVLPDPFFVLATQNPIEQEGTYPLPEAQLDRFMFNVVVEYPSETDEIEILRRTTDIAVAELPVIMTGEEILRLQGLVRRVPIADDMLAYASRLVRATRPEQPDAPDFVRTNLRWGAGPRAGQYLVLGAKARAVIKGRFHVSIEDIQRAARPVLRHRILTNYSAQAEGIRPDDIIDRLLEAVPAHPTPALNDGGLPRVVGSPGR